MEFIDLTYPIEEGMPTFNAHWHIPVSIKKLGRHGFEGRETREITFGTHTGTQIDAPLHFIEGGRSIENIPLDKLIGRASIVDFSSLKENEAVSLEMIEKVPVTQRMILKFGWGKFWNNKKFYDGYPYLSEEAARYLVSKGVQLLGIDTPSPDDSRIQLTNKNILGSAQDSPIHKILLRNEIILLECLGNLDLVNESTEWNIIALPLKIKGADGSPARICLYK